MGFRLEVYSDNYVGLIVDFNNSYASNVFCDTNDVEEAMKYFDLYKEEMTGRLKRHDPNERALEQLAVSPEEVGALQNQLEMITESLSDEMALQCVLLFPEWNAEKSYEVGNRVRYEGGFFRCLQAHDAQADWMPHVATSLWASLLIDPTDPEPQDWVQPDSTNGYMQGDKVVHNGLTYESQVDNNVWEPGAAGTESLWIEI